MNAAANRSNIRQVAFQFDGFDGIASVYDNGYVFIQWGNYSGPLSSLIESTRAAIAAQLVQA
jgi:hypothetical protein